ncbi:dihydroorotase family protein [bacterium]|jgi:dihydroorotase|nr:dihydroorotase family protein [bacterium]MBT6831595.1 dihydroorotase family protein [bacterium]MBT6995890.1 dihydroorotase family protein [bacterium]MBT7772664.1 dihydroorotase family protein [bacterium]
MNFKIENVRIVDASQDTTGSVVISDGKISEIREFSVPFPTKILIPGAVDPHVHFRDPPDDLETAAEDFFSGSSAAAAGGVTTIFEMPNTNPPVFSAEILSQKHAIAAQKSIVRWGLFFGASGENLSEISKISSVPGVKLYANDTTGKLLVAQESAWRELFQLGKKIVVHAEGETFLRLAEIWKSENFPCALHLAHTARAIEVSKIRELKTKTSQISAEVAPHHLFFTESDVDGGWLRMKPELGIESDRDALWDGIFDGTIDFLASDHAPHPISKKNSKTPAFGVPGAQFSLPLILSEWLRRGWDLRRFVEFTSLRAAELFGISRGKISVGADADLALIDFENQKKISELQNFSRCGWTSYSNFKIPVVEKTWIGGVCVFQNQKIVAGDFRAGEEIFSEKSSG